MRNDVMGAAQGAVPVRVGVHLRRLWVRVHGHGHGLPRQHRAAGEADPPKRHTPLRPRRAVHPTRHCKLVFIFTENQKEGKEERKGEGEEDKR